MHEGARLRHREISRSDVTTDRQRSLCDVTAREGHLAGTADHHEAGASHRGRLLVLNQSDAAVQRTDQSRASRLSRIAGFPHSPNHIQQELF